MPPEIHEITDATADTLVLPAYRADGEWLLEVGSSDDSRTLELGVGRPLVLGSGRNADVRLSDRSVSSRHCAVTLTPAGVQIDDLGSTNGLYVGGARLASALLGEDGSSFVIGRTSVAVRQGHAGATDPGSSRPRQSPEPLVPPAWPVTARWLTEQSLSLTSAFRRSRGPAPSDAQIVGGADLGQPFAVGAARPAGLSTT